MAEHRLKAVTALGGTEPRIDSFDVLTISENAEMALASLACRNGRQAEFLKQGKKLLGCDLPEAGAIAGKGVVKAIWIGPDQWFIEAPFETHEDIARHLVAAFSGTASVTEQTDAWVRFDIEGPATGTVFERLCALNVGGMASGSASRTAIEHLGCFVLCREAGIRYTVLGPRSGAASLHHALMTAARSVL